MPSDLVKRLRDKADRKTPNLHAEMQRIETEAANEIERLRAALRTIDNAIPKNDPTLPAICLVAGDVAESALNGTWPAFGVMPRAALEGEDD